MQQPAYLRCWAPVARRRVTGAWSDAGSHTQVLNSSLETAVTAVGSQWDDTVDTVNSKDTDCSKNSTG